MQPAARSSSRSTSTIYRTRSPRSRGRWYTPRVVCDSTAVCAKASSSESATHLHRAPSVRIEYSRVVTYPIGTPGQPWGDAERALWRSQQAVKRRYTDARFPTPSGTARFWPRPHELLGERADADFPLILTTGRVRSHWHTRTKTALVPQLNAHDDRPYVSMHPADAARLNLGDARPVEVHSRRGVTRTTLRIDSTVPPGTAFMPIHWHDLFARGASPNEATSDDADAASKQPALKACAVRVVGADST